MAERRMFAKTIIDSDAFIDMPLSTQALYFHLSMRGDDEGFINNPRKIQRMIGASDDDLKVLISKRFIIPFESGIVVIKHWKLHNYIRKDRLIQTVYQDEKKQLIEKENGSYTFAKYELEIEENDLPKPNVSHMSDICQSNVSIGKDSIGKYSIDKYSIGKNSIDNNIIIADCNDRMSQSQLEEEFNQIWTMYPKKQGKANALKAYIKARKKGTEYETVLSGLENYVKYITIEKIEPTYVKHGSTWFNQECWNDDYIITRKPTTKDLVETGNVNFDKFRN